MKKAIALALSLALSLGLLAGCGGSKEPEYNGPSYASLKVGEDYTDLKADLRVITHRTDLIQENPDGRDFTDFVKEFNALYPNITINYEGITDYANDMSTRISSKDWGDICMVPQTILLPDLGLYFHPLCSLSEIEADYNFATNRAYDGKVYGIPSTGNAQGIIYNKKVAEAAGYTSENLPKNPDEFLKFLQAIKDKTDAIPLYTNFADAWCVGAWDAYVGIASTGDQDFRNYKIAHMANPFADPGDGTGAYNVYKCLYEAVARGLVEEDPMSTDWEGSKGMINRGEIGVMVLGSWAVAQFQQAGDNPQDIGYMPFPITVKNAEGKRVTSAGGNYSYAINSKTSTDQQIASMLYVKWLLDASPIFEDEGCIPARKDAALPAFLASFEGIELLANNPAPAGHEDDFDTVNLESEVGISNDNYPDANIVECAMQKNKEFSAIMDEWNAKWSKAQESKGMEIEF